MNGIRSMGYGQIDSKKQSEEIRNIDHAVELGIPEFVSTFSKLIAPYAEFFNSIRPKIDSYKPALERIAEATEAFEALDKLGDNQYVLWKSLSRELVAEIKTAEGVNLNSYRFGDAGMEPAVIGTAVTLNEGELSAPVKGVQGVYVLQSVSKQTTEAEVNVEQEIQQLNMRYAYSLPYQALNLIQEKAEITDNRSNFY